MPHNFVCITQRNFVADFLQAKCDFTWKMAILQFLGTMYDVHLRLIQEHVVDFLLMLTELFLLGVTAKALRTKIA